MSNDNEMISYDEVFSIVHDAVHNQILSDEFIAINMRTAHDEKLVRDTKKFMAEYIEKRISDHYKAIDSP